MCSQKVTSEHACVCSDHLSDGSPADGALEPLSLELQATGHAHTHVPAAVDNTVYAGLRADDTVSRRDSIVSSCMSLHTYI